MTTSASLRSTPRPLLLERRVHGGGRASEALVGAVAEVVGTVDVQSDPVVLMLAARLVATGDSGEETVFCTRERGHLMSITFRTQGVNKRT